MTNVTLTTEQAQQIEEALEDIVRVFKFETGTPVEALAVIRAARAQEQAEQEPVSMFEWQNGNPVGLQKAAPVRTKDLTDDEIVEALGYDKSYRLKRWVLDDARAVIAADRELNR